MSSVGVVDDKKQDLHDVKRLRILLETKEGTKTHFVVLFWATDKDIKRKDYRKLFDDVSMQGSIGKNLCTTYHNFSDQNSSVLVKDDNCRIITLANGELS